MKKYMLKSNSVKIKIQKYKNCVKNNRVQNKRPLTTCRTYPIMTASSS